MYKKLPVEAVAVHSGEELSRALHAPADLTSTQSSEPASSRPSKVYMSKLFNC